MLNYSSLDDTVAAIAIVIFILIGTIYYIYFQTRRNQTRNVKKCKKSKKKLSSIHSDVDDYSSAIEFIGMDCEMVGVGRNGRDSMLARCSLVTIEDYDNTKQRGNIKVLYDAYVRPSKHVTDYRTQWSGITKKRLNQHDVITLHQCRMDVLSLLSSSSDGKKVVLVGHALKNDFDVLNIQHPLELIRDTASYRPLMRRVRKRHYPRKLSELTHEHLGINIQNHGVPSLLYEKESKNEDDDNNNPSLGHDSIEDAAAALMLYKKFSTHWEKTLGYPLFKFLRNEEFCDASISYNSRNQSPITLYLDGCNLPIGLRQHRNNDDKDNNNNNFTTTYQLLSKTHKIGNKTQTPIDWIPILRSIVSLSKASHNKRNVIGKICIFFDGKMFTKTLVRPKPLTDLGDGLFLEVTDDSIEVDDVLVERCIVDRKEYNISPPYKQNFACTNIDNVIEEFEQGVLDHSNGNFNINKHFVVVVKRKGGGTKTNKKLFDKLCLRRGEEGAFCLLPSFLDIQPTRLQKNSINIAKDLKKAKVHHIVQYEKRPWKDVRSIVVTDDVLLSDRVVQEGGVVMRYSQFKQLM